MLIIVGVLVSPAPLNACTDTIHQPYTKYENESSRNHSLPIEPTIGHLKQDYRLCRNFLKGIVGDNINVLLSAAAWNFRRRIILWLTEAIKRWLLTYNLIAGISRGLYTLKIKVTF